MERLAAAILLKAVEEWQDPQKHSEIEIFLKSEWFKELAEVAQVNPSVIREKLLSDTYHKEINTRSAYR